MNVPTRLIANARMYSVAPEAAAAWKQLFAWIIDRSGVPLDVIDHAFPAKLDDLWAREDLACVFMCGWPHLRRGGRHPVIAAPIPDADWAVGRPVYRTLFVVRADASFTRLEDCFGRRMGWTIQDSHSGYNAPRHHLLPWRGPEGRDLFAETVGPLTTPRRVLEALAENRIDVGPLDGFAYLLLRRHAPELAGPTRVIDATPLVPIPAFVAAPGVAADVVDRLRATLAGFALDPATADLRRDLCVTGFTALDPAGWAVTEDWARAAEARGLDVIR